MRLNRRGFTVVELLVVIVVIGILAGITIVAYTNIQRQARNASTISSTKQIIESFRAYRTYFKANPANVVSDPNQYSGGYCLTQDNKCSNYEGIDVTSDNTALLNELKKMSSIPEKGAPLVDGNYYGIYLDYNDARTVNGKPNKYLIMYRLEGVDQKCSISNLVTDEGFVVNNEAGSKDVKDGEGNLIANPYVSSPTPWSYSGFGGVKTTECWISVE